MQSIMILSFVLIASFHLALANPLSSLVGTIEIETPPYDIVSKGDNYEVRRYHPQLWVQVDFVVDPATDFNDKESLGFEPIFQYISGANERKQKIPMTAPVVMEQFAGDSGHRRMAFIMPASEFSTLDQLPKPTDPTVQLVAVDQPLLLACIKFDMELTTKRVTAEEAELRQATKKDNIDLVDERESVRVEDYNTPWTLPWLRRNDLCIPLVKQA